MEFINCDICDEEYCKYGNCTIRCDDVPHEIDGVRKCDICTSDGYDCEVANCFICKCPIKK